MGFLPGSTFLIRAWYILGERPPIGLLANFPKLRLPVADELRFVVMLSFIAYNTPSTVGTERYFYEGTI